MSDKSFAEVAAKILMRGVKPRISSKAAIQPQAAALDVADEVRQAAVLEQQVGESGGREWQHASIDLYLVA